MNLKGKTGVLSDGRRFTIIKYNEGIVDIDNSKVNDSAVLNIEGEESNLLLFVAANSGYLKFDDSNLTEELLEYYDELITSEKNQVEEAEKAYAERNANKTIAPQRVIDLPGLSKNYLKYMDTSRVYKYSDLERMHNIQIRYNGNGIKVASDEIILLSYLHRENGKLMFGDDFTDDEHFIYCGQDERTNPRAKNNNDAVSNSNSSNKTVHLYISAASNEYYYQGKYKVLRDFFDKNGKRMFELVKF